MSHGLRIFPRLKGEVAISSFPILTHLKFSSIFFLFFFSAPVHFPIPEPTSKETATDYIHYGLNTKKKEPSMFNKDIAFEFL